MIWFTSDLHLGSPNTIKYFNRPYCNVDRMNEVLIKTINLQCKSEDTLIHVGDFATHNNEKGVSCSKISTSEYLSKINCNVVLIEGNHDRNNRVKCLCKYMISDLGGYRNISIGHYPSHDPLANHQFRKHSIRICGHVHTAWKYYWDHEHDVLNINVGCDVWKWAPIQERKLITYIDNLERQLKHKWH